MPQDLGTLQYNIVGNIQRLDVSINEAERKLKALKDKAESNAIGLKIDTSNIDKALSGKHALKPTIDTSELAKQVSTAFNNIQIKPIKIQLDLSDAMRQLSALEAGMSRIKGNNIGSTGMQGGAFLGAFVGDIAGGYVAGRFSSKSQSSVNNHKNIVNHFYGGNEPPTGGSPVPNPPVPPTGGFDWQAAKAEFVKAQSEDLSYQKAKVAAGEVPTHPPDTESNIDIRKKAQEFVKSQPYIGTKLTGIRRLDMRDREGSATIGAGLNVATIAASAGIGGMLGGPVGAGAGALAGMGVFAATNQGAAQSLEKLKEAASGLNDRFMSLGSMISGLFSMAGKIGKNPTAPTPTQKEDMGDAYGGYSSSGAPPTPPGDDSDSGSGGKGKKGSGFNSPILNRLGRRLGISKGGGIGIASTALAAGYMLDQGVKTIQANQLDNATGENQGYSAYLRRRIEQPTDLGSVLLESIKSFPGGSLVTGGIDKVVDSMGGKSLTRQKNESLQAVGDLDYAMQTHRENTENLQSRFTNLSARYGLYGGQEDQINSIKNANVVKILEAGEKVLEQQQVAKGRYYSKLAAEGIDENDVSSDKYTKFKEIKKERDDRLTEINDRESSRFKSQKELENAQIGIIEKRVPLEITALRKSLTDSLGSALATVDAQYVNDPEKGKIARANVITQFQRQTEEIQSASNVTGLRLSGASKEANIKEIRDKEQRELAKITGTDRDSYQQRAAISSQATGDVGMVNKQFNESLREMAAQVNITKLGISQFGSAFKVAEAQIENEYKKAIFGHENDPEVVQQAKEQRAASKDALQNERVLSAEKENQNITQMSDRNEVRKMMLGGNGVGATLLEAELKGKEKMDALELKHKTPGAFNNEDDYIREKAALQDEIKLDKLEARRKVANNPAQAMGSFMGAFFIEPTVAAIAPKAPAPQMFGPPAPPNLAKKALPKNIQKHGPNPKEFGPPAPEQTASGEGGLKSVLEQIERNTAKQGVAVAV